MKLLSKDQTHKKIPSVCFIYYQSLNSILYREAKALRNRGFRVDIICRRNFPGENIVSTFDGIQLYRIQSRSKKEKKTLMYFLRLALFGMKSFALVSFLSLIRKYDLIHVTSPPDVMVFAALVPKLLGAKIILDIHDIGPELYMRKLHVDENKPIIKFIKFTEYIAARFSDHVITVTDLWKNKLISRSVPSHKCTVLLNVPDEGIFKHSKTNRRQAHDGVGLYYHGSLEEHFGVDTLLEAMPIIIEHIPDAALFIYGQGRLLNDFQVMARDLKIEQAVNFYNVVPFYELPSVLEDADLGIVPTKDSVFSDEAVSMKSLEYMSLGIPVVISRTSAHDYYYNDQMVRFFAPGNSLDLAAAIIALYNDRGERKRLLRNSLAFLKKHGWNNAKKTYFQIVDQLVGNN